jgi:hypothetical protein
MTTGYASNGPVFSIWVDGVEVNGIYLPRDDAEALADFWREEGYDEVVVKLFNRAA